MKIKTSELINGALDWAVHVALGSAHLGQSEGVSLALEFDIMHSVDPDLWYSTDWSQGGPIIERERFVVEPWGLGWVASVSRCNLHHGTTPLVAAMRCFVASKLGDEVEMPDELI